MFAKLEDENLPINGLDVRVSVRVVTIKHCSTHSRKPVCVYHEGLVISVFDDISWSPMKATQPTLSTEIHLRIWKSVFLFLVTPHTHSTVCMCTVPWEKSREIPGLGLVGRKGIIHSGLAHLTVVASVAKSLALA